MTKKHVFTLLGVLVVLALGIGLGTTFNLFGQGAAPNKTFLVMALHWGWVAAPVSGDGRVVLKEGGQGTQIVVKKGDTVRLILYNPEGMGDLHDTLEAQSADFYKGKYGKDKYDKDVAEMQKADSPIRQHSFKLDAFKDVNGKAIDVTLKDHELKMVDFKADKDGTFSFICNVICSVNTAGHTDMKGELVVEK
ncbi:hypothetical protein HY230_04050 [Candidatus Acetothermia bacterium]|nr:hypothetical protein [Candidatus Acetothermia bacterium]MBI3659627.1 hypothetical protein [Candidatus Acetothermia bacterium]